MSGAMHTHQVGYDLQTPPEDLYSEFVNDKESELEGEIQECIGTNTSPEFCEELFEELFEDLTQELMAFVCGKSDKLKAVLKSRLLEIAEKQVREETNISY